MAQYFHVDESGDPGLERAAGSSSHFVLAMVQLPDRVPLHVIAAVREELHLSSEYEFKHFKSTSIQKAYFFKSVQSLRFRVRAVVVNKRELHPSYRTMNGQELTIEFLTRLTLRASDLDIGNDVLVMDGATRAFLRALRIRLSEESRVQKRVRPFRQLVSGDSKRDDGLQLADMIAGAIMSSTLNEDTTFYSTFAKKIVDLWQVP